MVDINVFIQVEHIDKHSAQVMNAVGAHTHTTIHRWEMIIDACVVVFV